MFSAPAITCYTPPKFVHATHRTKTVRTKKFGSSKTIALELTRTYSPWNSTEYCTLAALSRLVCFMYRALRRKIMLKPETKAGTVRLMHRLRSCHRRLQLGSSRLRTYHHHCFDDSMSLRLKYDDRVARDRFTCQI